MADIAAQIAALKEERRGYENAGKKDRVKAVDEQIDYLTELAESEPPEEAAENVDPGLAVAAGELGALRRERAGYEAAGKTDRVKAVDASIQHILKEWPVLDETETKAKATKRAPRPEDGDQETVTEKAPERSIPPKPGR
ncbi:MAG TPA: hypothetical protein VFJ85_02870 [Acidimicrobiales bacterium]|nr:hypothetical protein [Acidimicrobiales bacterium]